MSASEKILSKGPALQKAEAVVFPVLLAVLALSGVDRGADLTDTAYSLGNYEQFGYLQGDWIYATYLSNLCGSILLKLSGGRLLFMNLLTALLPLAAALAVWFTLRRRISPRILFLGELAALGLCWCPTVILYNYLSYLLFTIAGLLLWRWSEGAGRSLLFAAGVVLGLSLLARISNLVYCIWILYVWYTLRDRKKEIPAATGLCIGGYLAGLAAAFALLFLVEAGRGGWQGAVNGLSGMFAWVSGLFTSSAGDAGGYSMGGMLRAIAGGYLFGAKWFLFMLAGILLGSAMFSFRKKEFLRIRTGLFLCGIALLFVYYFRNGVFTVRYYNNGCIYGIGTILLLVFLLLFAWVASPFCHRALLRKEKGLAFFGLLALLAAPLGSNNHLYAVLNQMFLTAPIGIFLLDRWILAQERKAWYRPLRCMFYAFLTLFLIQSVLFGSIYVFKDGEDGSRQDAVILHNAPLCGMRTSAAHRQAVEELTAELEHYPDGRLITYGNLPGLHYILGREPALSTLWPDLDSYALSGMAQELEGLAGQELLVITAAQMPEYGGDMQKKYSLLQDFVYNNGYVIKYGNEEFTVYGKIQ